MRRPTMSRPEQTNLAPSVARRRLAGWRPVLIAATLLVPSLPGFAFDQFIKPTAEELSMTSVPGYPGVPAVVLFREELTKDDLHFVQHYNRIKILTDDGKKYGNVELGFYSSIGNYDEAGDNKMVADIVGRTIHADGTVIPFTGKPYLKLLEKGNGYKIQEKVFTLPDVEVGSIIEYRYSTRFSDMIVEPPTWLVQDDIPVKQAHFRWYPTSQDITNGGKTVQAITWFPILPPGAEVQRREIPGNMLTGATQIYELTVNDVPPKTQEEYMPPIGSYSYRVHFSFTPYRTHQEFWANEGKSWSKRVNSFSSPNGALKDATEKVIAGAATPEEKLRKIYDAVMQLENTRYTRSRDKREDKAAGVSKVSNVSDVLTRGRGSATELTELFIGMARAAGLNAYAMLVPDRSEELFTPDWLSFNQFDDLVAIVSIDGKDRYFDPGSRYCAFGQLAWQHTYVAGLRQTDAGTAFGQTIASPYKENRTQRVANLTMDDQGTATGKIDLTFQGAPALEWRQTALRGDDESLRKSLRESLERMVPRTLEVEVTDIKHLTEYHMPLLVTYQVKGTIATSAGKRVMLPADVFVAGKAATFPHEKRDSAVYFHYPEIVQDAVRVNLPTNLAIEAVPAKTQLAMSDRGAYAIDFSTTPTSVTMRRDYIFGDFVVYAENYSALRTFYSKLESKDQESVVLKAPSKTATNTGDASGSK